MGQKHLKENGMVGKKVFNNIFFDHLKVDSPNFDLIFVKSHLDVMQPTKIVINVISQ